MYARYTAFLRDLMKNEHTSKLLDEALSTYPIYQPEKKYDMIPTREELNKRILNHYKYREIGFETVGRFLDELQNTMEEIMPVYNERLKTIEIMAEIPNPFDNIDIEETYEESTTGTGSVTGTGTTSSVDNKSDHSKTTSSSSNTNENSGTNSQTTNSESNSESTGHNDHEGFSKTIESDTPQDSLTITAESIDSVSYASNAKWDKNVSADNSSTNNSDTSKTSTTGEARSMSKDVGSSTVESTTTGGGTSDHQTSSNTQTQNATTRSHTFKRVGQQGVSTFANDIDEYRSKAIIDVVYEIITDSRLNELFMMIF